MLILLLVLMLSSPAVLRAEPAAASVPVQAVIQTQYAGGFRDDAYFFLRIRAAFPGTGANAAFVMP